MNPALGEITDYTDQLVKLGEIDVNNWSVGFGTSPFYTRTTVHKIALGYQLISVK